MSRSSSSFGFRSSFNSSGRKSSREVRKETTHHGSTTSTSKQRPCVSNHHDPHSDDHHHRHNLHEKRQRSRHNNTEAEKAARSIFGDVPLTDTERRYLWSAQSGNLPALELLVEDAGSFNLCCRDYLGRTALQLSVLGEHYDCIQLLLNRLRHDIIEEGLLHAIKANNVKICDMFLSQPLYSDPRARLQFHLDHQNGLYEQEDSSSSFANDITPIVLAAQCNNFDIVHMLIQKGFTISTPHNYFCLCPECQTFKDQDRVVHSKSRLNAYRGLASTAYLSLSCDDPIYAAFELSRNLEKLADREKEHKNEYRGLSNQCKDFAVALLDQCRTNDEVMSALHGGTDTFDLARIKMAIRYDQKKFIAHASCQEQLASMWYSGAPYFQHQSFVIKLLLVPLGIVFIPLTAIIYVFVPYSKLGRILKSPFMKFMNYICSYMAFLVLLFLGTQLTSFQSVHLFNGVEGVVNGLIMFYVLGMFWAECKQLWEEGIHDYFAQMWNYMDITMLALYTAGYSIEGVIYNKADSTELSENHLLHWKDSATLNPQILSKILFSVANVMSFARIAYILPASETFGQLQISYGRMLQDVGKFIFIYVTVMIAFICGLTSLYSITTNSNFSGLSETTGTLFWAAFGLGNAKAPGIGSSGNTNNGGGGGVDDRGHGRGHAGGASGANVGGRSGGADGGGSGGGGGGTGGAGDEVTHAESLRVVQMVGYILYGVYILGAVVVLINMLIAMMSNTFEEIQKSEDCEWKFARAKLWISFIEQGTTLPIPFNIIPTPKSIVRMTKVINGLLRCRQGKFDPSFEDSQRVALEYKAVMHRVVLRYIHKMKFENREDSLKDEILDTREEVLYQMHSLMSRMSYRMETLENDMLAVSKGVQAVTGGPNLTYTKSVPAHGRSSLGSIRHNTSSTSLSAQDKGGGHLSTGVPNLRRGRSYYHTRPKYKLSDHSIPYNPNEQPNPLTSGTAAAITTTTTTTNITNIPTTNNNSLTTTPTTTSTTTTTTGGLVMKSLHTHRSLSDSGYNKDEEDPCDFLAPLPSQSVTETGSSSIRTTAGIASHHNSSGQDQIQGQGFLPVIGVTSSSGLTKPIPETASISTISDNCLDDASTPGVFVDDDQADTDFRYRRVNSVNVRGSYSPRPGEERHKIMVDAGTSRPAGPKRSDVVGSNPRWAGQPDVIEESWLEDHPSSLHGASSLGMKHATPLDPLDVGPNIRHCGSVRRRRETMSHHPNIDAPFQPVADQGNTFTEYRYSKPKRRETLQNLILDVNNIHKLPGLDIGQDPGSRTPVTGSSDGGSSAIGRSSIGGDRRSLSPPSKSNALVGGTSSKEHTAKASSTPRSADEPKRSPWFNWSSPFVMFYGNHSQENLYYPMQMIQQECAGRDGGEIKGINKNNAKNTRKKSTNKSNSGGVEISNKTKGSEPPPSSFSQANFNQNDKPNSMQTNTPILPEYRSQFPEIDSAVNPTDDDLQRRAGAIYHDGKSTTSTTSNAATSADPSYKNQSLKPLTLEETEGNQHDLSHRHPTRKFGMGNIQNVNPILLGEKSFFESLLSSVHDPSNSNDINNRNRKISAESVSSVSIPTLKPDGHHPDIVSETHSAVQNLQQNKADDLKYYDELKHGEQHKKPSDKIHDFQITRVENIGATHRLPIQNTTIVSRTPIGDSQQSEMASKLTGNATQQQQQQQLQQQQNQRRHILLQQHNHQSKYNLTGSLDESHTDDFLSTHDQDIAHSHVQHVTFPVDTQTSPTTNDTVIDFLECTDQPHLDPYTGRHFSDSCVIPLPIYGDNLNQQQHHQHYNHQHLHHPHHHQSQQHQPHAYIQNERLPPNRIYHQNPRKHAFPSTNVGDHQRLATVPASMSCDDEDLTTDDDNDGDTCDNTQTKSTPSAFIENLTTDHENRRGITHRDIYIPPMASNLIPFSVVPNSTPIHAYSGACHRPGGQDGEKIEDERQSSGGGGGGAGGEETGDRKRKTSSGRKISLVSLVRGRRSDKVKEKQPEISHNRSLSLNRFQGRHGNRSKHLTAQGSKEV